jgi:hypothetical protein
MIDFVRARKSFLKATEDYDNQEWNDWSNNPFTIMAPPLSDSHLRNCRVLESREKMLEFLPANSIVAEVGTLYGHFAEKILSITKPIKLHIIDINLSLFKKELELKQKEILLEKIEDNTIELHQGDSSWILGNFPDDYFDWIYIDADHSYEGVRKDIQEGHTKLKEDGLLIFNDYTHWSMCELISYGVPRAVNEFCIANNWEIVLFALDSHLGYHDVAIKRMKRVMTTSI